MHFKDIFQGFILFFVFLAILGVFIFGSQAILQKNQIALSSISGAFSGKFPEKNDSASGLEISAKSAISIWTDFAGSEKVLFEKNQSKRLPIASLTKLVSALVAMENFNLGQKIAISASSEKMEEGRPDKILKAGQEFSAESLIGLMLSESNSAAAFSLSEAIGDEKFVEQMNKKAREAGVAENIFSTSIGRGPTNLASVSDVAKIIEYIYKNKPQILQISAAKEYPLYDFYGHFVRNAKSTDELLFDDTLASRIFGGKTGETSYAGECLSLVLKAKDGKFLINIILGSDDRFAEMKKMIDWVDSSFKWEEEKQQPIGKEFDPAALSWENLISSAPWEQRDSLSTVVYKNKIWLMGGLDGNGFMSAPGFVDYNSSPYFSDVWSSEDGINWARNAEKSPWGDRRSVQVVDFKGKMWLMGGYSPEYGYKNDIWSSEDGANWKKEAESANWPAREGHQMVVFKDKLWLIGGVRYDKSISAASTMEKQLFNDVWYSDDGINWTEAAHSAQWSPRWDDSVAVFRDKLWLVGGMVFGSKMYNDVWYSDDGINWTLALENAPFESRQGNFLTEYKGKLWTIGRLDGINGGANDAWYSEDGVTWKKTNADPAWFGREDFGAVVFKDKIWIMGGMDKNWEWRNDVWSSTF